MSQKPIALPVEGRHLAVIAIGKRMRRIVSSDRYDTADEALAAARAEINKEERFMWLTGAGVLGLVAIIAAGFKLFS